MTTGKRIYSMTEACRYLGGISRGKVYQLMGDGSLKSLTIGNRRYFRIEDLDRFVDDQADKAESCDDSL
jgi:excisionase family DNA binding protein